jgi:hypothetical protein
MTENTDPAEAALAAFSSASWALERIARNYAEAVIASEREGFREFCREQDEDADPTDLVHEYVDGLETVIYTHRARALVIGWGEDEARDEFRSEMGEDAPGFEALAYLILSRECYEVAHEVEVCRDIKLADDAEDEANAQWAEEAAQ